MLIIGLKRSIMSVALSINSIEKDLLAVIALLIGCYSFEYRIVRVSKKNDEKEKKSAMITKQTRDGIDSFNKQLTSFHAEGNGSSILIEKHHLSYLDIICCSLFL